LVDPHVAPPSSASSNVDGHSTRCAQYPASGAGMICHCVPVQYALVSHDDRAAEPYSQV